jgi:hypothetical protein
MATAPLVPAQIETVLQGISINMLGLPAPQSPTDPVYETVRVGWQQEGQPAWKIDEDVTFIRCVEEDDQYNRVRDIAYSALTTGGLTGFSVANGGSGYQVGDVLTPVQAGGSGSKLVVGAAFGGAVSSLSSTVIGNGYQLASNVPTTGGHGTGCVINILNVLGGGLTKTTNYTRVWRVYWDVYGPNSFDNARLLRTRLFDQDVHDQFSAALLWMVTDPAAPVRAPELFANQWWERVSFSARFNEFVTETLTDQAVASTEVIVLNSGGTIADIEVT